MNFDQEKKWGRTSITTKAWVIVAIVIVASAVGIYVGAKV